MGALRAARGFTGRDLVVKFEGCYHGGADYLLVKAGSGLATFGAPDSAGVPAAIAGTTLVLPFNDVGALRALFDARGHEIAAVILEPVVGNMGLVPPAPGFLQELRTVTEKAQTVLVFDEVMTGFRVAHGGAQALYNTSPIYDTGKIVGGGCRRVYGGARIMGDRSLGRSIKRHVAAMLATAAGLATLAQLRAPGFYDSRARLGKREKIFSTQRATGACSGCSGRSCSPPFFQRTGINWSDAAASDTKAFVASTRPRSTHELLAGLSIRSRLRFRGPRRPHPGAHRQGAARRLQGGRGLSHPRPFSGRLGAEPVRPWGLTFGAETTIIPALFARP